MHRRNSKSIVSQAILGRSPVKNTQEIKFDKDLESLKKIDEQTADNIVGYFDKFVRSTKMLDCEDDNHNSRIRKNSQFRNTKESRRRFFLQEKKRIRGRNKEVPRLKKRIVQNRKNYTQTQNNSP
ncbi:unnamed protein product [Moneuplotes crassus]|uniref:Uncharacterized protein n=1 Tax=Euplotes crassus TaxID=5936 RepID=A0AAD1ULF5_EUPCR|nr:unnamed protein product [Moneuplotes crassus]